MGRFSSRSSVVILESIPMLHLTYLALAFQLLSLALFTTCQLWAGRRRNVYLVLWLCKRAVSDSSIVVKGAVSSSCF